jgi:hypothetical protein
MQAKAALRQRYRLSDMDREFVPVKGFAAILPFTTHYNLKKILNVLQFKIIALSFLKCGQEQG